MNRSFKGIDPKEVILPETLFIRDIDTKVFQSIIFECLQKIEGIAPIESSLIETFLVGEKGERVKGIHVDQDEKNHSVKVRVDVYVAYGISIPEKAEEIQSKIVQEISQWTGLHVSSVHVVFKSLIAKQREGSFSEEKEELFT